VLLPRQFNDGREIPGEWISEAILEIVDHFGTASHETQSIHGHWQARGNPLQGRPGPAFLLTFPIRLRIGHGEKVQGQVEETFEQVELWMVSYPVDIE